MPFYNQEFGFNTVLMGAETSGTSEEVDISGIRIKKPLENFDARSILFNFHNRSIIPELVGIFYSSSSVLVWIQTVCR